MTSQPPNPGLSLRKEEWEASVYTDFAFSKGLQIITRIHVNASIPLDLKIEDFLNITGPSL